MKIMKSFQIALILLVASAILTALKSVRHDTPERKARALRLSTMVCVIASCHYALMLLAPDTAVVTQTRYLDWFFTTPLLLYELMLVTHADFSWRPIVSNFPMLLVGYWGETGAISRAVSTPLGFVGLVDVAASLHARRYADLVSAFFSLWSLYGVAHVFPSISNDAYNVLDILTKAGFGVLIHELP